MSLPSGPGETAKRGTYNADEIRSLTANGRVLTKELDLYIQKPKEICIMQMKYIH